MIVGGNVMETWQPPNAQYPPPKPGEPALHRAARTGDHDAIRRLIAGGADPDDIFDIGLAPQAAERPATPLMVAAGSGDGATDETVNLLLSLGADPAHEVDQISAVHFACSGLGWNYRPGGDALRLEVLLEAGCPFDVTDPAAARAMADLASQGDPGRLTLMIGIHAPVNPIWDREAARESIEAIHESLEEHRAKYDDSFANLPHEISQELQAAELESRLEDIQVFSTAPCFYEIPLFQAAASGSLQCVQLLLAAGADTFQRDESQQTVVWYAGSESVARFLEASGLSLEFRDRFGFTPLIGNVDNMKRARALVAAGSNVNAIDDEGLSVLMHAAGAPFRQAEIVRFLIANGADPHAVSKCGQNAFHAAIDVSCEANVEQSVRGMLTLLKELGVDMELKNNAGYTPLGRAIEAGTGIEVRVLCELGADVNATGPLRICTDEDCTFTEAGLIFLALDSVVDTVEKVAAMLTAGASLKVRDHEGRTPLAFAKNKHSYHQENGEEDWAAALAECERLLKASST